MSASPALSSRTLSELALAESCRAALAHWNGHDPLWVFAYGSLVWNPELEFDKRVPARAFGYHRRLCLRSVHYRGTPEYPGVVAGLDRGGSCAGVAYRIPAVALREQFERLWRREMFMGSYRPRWLTCRRLDRVETMPALAFTVRRDVENYCGSIDERELLAVLVQARGASGSSLDYLMRTIAALRAAGVPDPGLERLAGMAHARLAQQHLNTPTVFGNESHVDCPTTN